MANVLIFSTVAKDPCDGIECEDKKICAYDHDTTWCECEQSETDCEGKICE